MGHSAYGPPNWPEKLLKWFCHEDQLEILQGDLHELYFDRLKKYGRLKAKLWYVREVIDLMRPFAFKKRSDQPYKNNFFPMFRNYFKVAYRNFFRQKSYSIINISGLSVGLTCFILIALFIQDELSYDKFHSKSDRIYRMIEHFESEGVGEHSASQPFPVAPTLINDYQGQIESVVRLFNFQSPSLALANREFNREFNESRVYFVDSTFFEIFDFELLQGDKTTALDHPNSILLTESMARKYFGDVDPMGKILEFQGDKKYSVKGILKDAPTNAHFQFDFLISFSSLRSFFNGNYPGSWYWNPCWTYILLNENNDKELLAGFLPEFVEKYFPEVIVNDVTLELQPLTDIHLKSNLDYEIQANGNEKNILIFGVIGVFVLLIAAINFINLSTAKSGRRTREVGVRKALGSSRGLIINQFMVESILYSMVSVSAAVLFVIVLLPQFNMLTEKSIHIVDLLTGRFIIGSLLLGIIVGLMAGFYPAFIISSMHSISALKGATANKKGLGFRQLLVVIQFAISMILIIGTFIAVKQLEMLQNNDVGFNKEEVVMIPVIRTPMSVHYDTYKDEALRHPAIHHVTCVEEIVGAKHQVGNYKFEGMTRSTPFPRLFVKHDFSQTMGIEMAAGRYYSEDIRSDDSMALVINEKLVQQMGWSNQEAIGKSVGVNGKRIIGVVKDFNFATRHHEIAPLVLDLAVRPQAFNLFLKYMAVRIDLNNSPDALAHLRSTWKGMMPERPFEYFFLDERLDRAYKSEAKLGDISYLLSCIAVLVACLGLFGLATFTTEQRTKEIGIRKVLGIKSTQIVVLLSKDFMLLIAIAFVVAIPATYLAVSSWLNGFAYRIDIPVWPFLAGGGITFAVAALTVAYHSLKASRLNPVDCIKYE